LARWRHALPRGMSPVLILWTGDVHRRLPIISSVRPAPGPPLIPCTVFLRDFTFVRVYVAAAAAAYDRCALLGRMHDGRRYPSIVDPWIVHLQLSKSKKMWPGRPVAGSSGSPLVLATHRCYAPLGTRCRLSRVLRSIPQPKLITPDIVDK